MVMINLKLLLLSWIIAKRQLIHDGTASRTSWEQSYDFIIVGAGTAGCTIAGRLSENPNVKVLLLEAGGAQSAVYTDLPALYSNISNKRPNLENNFYSEPQLKASKQFSGSRSPMRRGNMLGGSSSHNSMVFIRGNPKDYDNWVKTYGAVGWSYKEVLPLFKKYENNTDRKIVSRNPGYHGTKGPVQISTVKNPPKFLKILQKTFNELGFKNKDLNAQNGVGTMLMQQFIDAHGVRSSASNAYIDPNPHPNNLHIVTKALVTKILFNCFNCSNVNGLTAVGVEFAKNDIPYRVYARKEIIITAGAINTPKLLMLSGIGISGHLRKLGIPVIMDLPVGNNFQDHPYIAFKSKIVNPAYFFPPPQLTVKQLSRFFYQGKGPQSMLPFLDLYFNTPFNKQKDWPNILLTSRIQFDSLSMSLIYARPRSRGTIRLQSTSSYIEPRVDPAYLTHPEDFNNVLGAVQFMFYIFEMSSIAPYISPPSFESIGCPVCPNLPSYKCIEGIKCYILNTSSTSYHTCCSTRMGAVNRPDVVVDPQLRVKNIKQLRVCDASVFPEIPNANINAAVHMVAEKCAHIIMKHYNYG